MIIKSNDIMGNTVTEIIRELSARADIKDLIEAKNLRGGDFCAAIAEALSQDEDVDTDDYLYIA